MRKIKIAIAGLGNCSSSLVQGIHYYRDKDPEDAVGLMHWDIGGYTPGDIEVVAAFDIDKRKVGKDVNEAIFADPNCTTVFCDQLSASGVTVRMGRIADGIADHMKEYEDRYTFLPSDLPEPSFEDVVGVLKESGAEILLNYMPVGSEKAACFYAECALEAGVALVNNIPVFIASDPEWARRFAEKNVPLIGDDIKSQLGATITHRVLTDLFRRRGVKLERTYQLNTGGNTDFLNMLERARLKSKKVSKTEAVTSQIPYDIGEDNVHIGPSDYVPWQKDNKLCFLRIEGKGFGGAPIELEARLSVQDSPNSAGIVIDILRYVKMARDRGLAGPMLPISAYTMKHPPVQMPDVDAARRIEEFLADGDA